MHLLYGTKHRSPGRGRELLGRCAASAAWASHRAKSPPTGTARDGAETARAREMAHRPADGEADDEDVQQPEVVLPEQLERRAQAVVAGPDELVDRRVDVEDEVVGAAPTSAVTPNNYTNSMTADAMGAVASPHSQPIPYTNQVTAAAGSSAGPGLTLQESVHLCNLQ